MIARPALDAVLVALRDADSPRAFEEALVARDLWPPEGAPEVMFQRWETEGSAVDVRRFKLQRLASIASCGVEALRTAENLIREAWRRLPHGNTPRVVWMTREPANFAPAIPDERATWRGVLAALRAGALPDLPLWIDPSFLEPLRAVFALGFDVWSVVGDRVVVVVPPLDAATSRVQAMRSAEHLILEASPRAPHGGTVTEVVWTTERPPDGAARNAMRGVMWDLLSALRAKQDTDRVPSLRGIDRRYLEALRRVFVMGFDVAVVAQGRAIVVASHLPDGENTGHATL